MARIISTVVKITTVGADGAAVGSAETHPESQPVEGFLLDVHLNYHASCPATADVTISDPTFGNLLVKSNNATDVWLTPRKDSVDGAGAATGLYDLIPVNSILTISVAQANALTDCLIATIRWITP